MKTLLTAIFLCSSALHADVKQAQALYAQAKALQNQKQYQAAIPLYIKSLHAEPRYAYSYKEIGTCKYMLGDKAGALEAYKRYLAAVPKDAAVQGMVTRINSELGAAPATGLAEPTGDEAPTARSRKTGDGESAELLWHSGFALSLGFGYNTYAMTDWNEYFKTPSTTSSGGTITSGFQVGLNVGYAMSAAMKLGLDVDYLMASSAETYSGGGSTTYNFPALWLGPKFEYGIVMGSVKIPIQLGVGWMTLSGAGGKSTFGSFSSSFNYTGSGFGVKLGSGLDWAIGKTFSMSLNLGYRVMAGITPVVGISSSSSGGSGGSFTLTKASSGGLGTPGNLVMDYSGLHAGLGLNFVF